jgi:polysaccharide pyruvyl transferase WcaK-like protein
MKIALLGFFAKQNFGDDLMAHHIPMCLGRGVREVTRYSDAHGDGVTCGLKDKSYLDCDVIAIGGGGIVSPEFWAFRSGGIERIVESGKPVAFVNVNVTPDYFSDAAFVQRVISLKARWWVRDQESVDILAGVGIACTLVPDISFRTDVAEYAPRLIPAGTREIAVFPNYYVLNGLAEAQDVECYLAANRGAREIARHLDWMTNYGWRITLWPAQTAHDVDDRLACAAIFSLMKHKDKARWVTHSPDWTELMAAIRDSDLVFSMRYHATTVALAMGRPFVDVTHHAKNRRLLSETGMAGASAEFLRLYEGALIPPTQWAEAHAAMRAAETWQPEECFQDGDDLSTNRDESPQDGDDMPAAETWQPEECFQDGDDLSTNRDESPQDGDDMPAADNSPVEATMLDNFRADAQTRWQGFDLDWADFIANLETRTL